MIHLFFPSLYSPDREAGPFLRSEERQEFYEKGLRPAIAQLAPTDKNDWPATFAGELFRARKRSGGMAYQTKMVPGFVVSVLVEEIRYMLLSNEITWAEDCFVMHTIRGTKHGTKHSYNRYAASLALDQFFEKAYLPRQIIEQSIQDGAKWYVDVGLEFSSSLDFCFQWKTTSHFHLVKEVLKIPEQRASHITTLSNSKYQRDISSHLPAVSGCRIEPGSRDEGIFGAVYYQQYTNEKSLTYNPEQGNHGKAIKMAQAMGEQQPSLFVQELYTLYRTAMTTNSSNARIEVRVPFCHATTALLQLDYGVVTSSLLAFTKHVWW